MPVSRSPDPMCPFTLDDLMAVARTLYGEARGSTRRDRVACAWVIRNRVLDPRWPNAWVRTCKQRRQFSCWNAGDPNNHPMLVAETRVAPFAECVAIAAAVMAGLEPDPTGGANHYHTAALARPRWADPARETGRIGAHVFYRL